MTRLSRRTAVLSGLTAGTAALVAGPEALVRAAASRATPSAGAAAPAAALAAHLDVAQPSFLAFLREAGIDTTLITRAAGGSGFIAPEPPFAPLPATAHGPTVPPSGYLVQEIRGGVYWVTDGSYQCMFLVTGQGVIAVDAPPSIGPNLLKAIASVTSEPVTHVVYSHLHADHIGSAHLLPANATYIAQADTAAYLRRDQDPRRPIPTVTFTDHYTLRVGDQVLQLDYKGENHVAGNIFIYAPRQQALMLVDVIFPGWVPFDYLAVSTNIPGWMTAYDQALTYPFTTFVGGHLNRLGTRQDALQGREYVHDLRANAAHALQSVDIKPIIQKVGYSNFWALYRTYLDTVVDTAAAATLAKWNGRLGAVDVFTHDNAYTMQTSLRID